MEITDRHILEKTLTTFHASNIVLQQQYRECRYNKYFKLVTTLLIVEKKMSS